MGPFPGYGRTRHKVQEVTKYCLKCGLVRDSKLKGEDYPCTCLACWLQEVKIRRDS